MTGAAEPFVRSIGPFRRLLARTVPPVSVQYVTALLSFRPGTILLSCLLAVAIGLTEGIGILLLIPLLQVAGFDIPYLGAGRIHQTISAAFALLGADPSLSLVLGIYIFFI